MKKTATLSACEEYRYRLTREWSEEGSVTTFIMLNPSTADANLDDQTIRKCVGFSKLWGCGRLIVVNLFSLRSRNPRDLYTHPAPNGPDADSFLATAISDAKRVIVAWGKHGKLHGRADAVNATLDTECTFALRLNTDGSPEHPLYVPYDVPLIPWPPKRE